MGVKRLGVAWLDPIQALRYEQPPLENSVNAEDSTNVLKTVGSPEWGEESKSAFSPLGGAHGNAKTISVFVSLR